MTVEPVTWEMYLRSQFPAYLLPESAAERLSVEEASRFLEGLTGKPSAFSVLRNVSFLAPRMADLSAFVRRVQEFVRSLPSTTETVQRHWNGGFQGKLDLRTTTFLHAQGRRTEFVTRTPRRDFDLPENIVLRSVCERIVMLLVDLRAAGMLPETGWGTGSRECEGTLRHALAATALRNVTSRPAAPHELAAARAARHPLCHEAAQWHDDLRAGLDDDDPARVARIVAEGALLPLEAPTRFEIAVAMKLIAAVSEHLATIEPGQWSHERGLVIANRKDIATLRRGDLTIRFFYNQAELEAGPTDRGVQHYFNNGSRMRPDVTVTICRGKVVLSALVVECKHSPNNDYLISGFHEAMLYRYEYASVLRSAVKAALVGSSEVPGIVREGDAVIAVTWADWPPNVVVASIVDATEPPQGVASTVTA